MLEKIEQARERIKNVAVWTPFSYSVLLSETNTFEVYLKKENLQLTGAFKLRGAFNKIATLNEDERKKGVVAASAGNHAQGVAYSARHFGISSIIVMPENTPLTKISGVKSYGSTVVLHGANYDEAYEYAINIAKESNLVFVHPFEDMEVIAGQGTIALEMLDDIPDLDAVVIPVGGGGLISGMAKAFKAIKPDIKVIGVSALGAPALKNSFDAKEVVSPVDVKTIADGIAVRNASDITLAHMIDSVDEVITVDDEEIASAILLLLEKQKLVVEGAGAVGVAALMHGKIESDVFKKVGVVLSGGNIDVTMLSVIIEKGLMKSSRKMKLIVTLIDKPGSLTTLSQLLASAHANIVHIGYDRTSTTLEYGDAHVTIHLETKGIEHQNEISSVLLENGYAYEQVT